MISVKLIFISKTGLTLDLFSNSIKQSWADEHMIVQTQINKDTIRLNTHLSNLMLELRGTSRDIKI